MKRHRFLTAIAVAACLAWTADASAQYFGRNKVVYEKFDFKVLKTEHFDIYYYPEEEPAVQLAARMAERWYARLQRLLRHDLSSRQPIILYAAHPHFEQTNVLPGELGEGTGGVTESIKRRIVMPFAGPLAETDHVLGHELVHAFQYDMASGVDVQGNRAGPGIMALPLWFIEGMAEYYSLGAIDSNTAMWVRDATSRDKMPTVDKLDDPDFFPYRYGHAFWAYIAGRWGDEAIADFFRATGPQGDIKSAMQTVLGMDPDQFTTEWHQATARTYAPIIESTRTAEAFGRPLISSTHSGGELNVGPALSPDGRRMVFLSEKDLFSIDMYVADIATGKVLRRIVKTSGDPHFDSLQFISSAGDWAPDNRRFVFAGVSKGQPILSIVNTDNGAREREQSFPTLGEIFNPAWSPDGKQIAFSALAGGVLDLYVWDIESGQLRQLTSDPYADLDPEWSPDGRELAFVTDRFSSNLDALGFGNYRIGAMNVASRQVRQLAGFATGRNTNPEFAADGRSMYFIGAPDGIANVYRADLRTSQTTKITNLRSGVSGITPLTPALSVAANAPQVAFSVFEDNRHSIYATETTAAPRQFAALDRNADVLPPHDRRPSEVTAFLQAPASGLPPQATFEEEPYKAELGLDAIGQPTIGIGADRFGAYAAGGIALQWSDLLGNHMVGTALQVTNRVDEIGAQVGYINRKTRWNWGIIGAQTPYVTGGFAEGFTSAGFEQQELRIIQTDRAVTGLAQYPFNRAQRIEFAAGVRNISFANKIETTVFSPITGQQIDSFTEDLPRPDSITLSEASTALVYDTSLFGATSPILGQRYRLELTQVTGTLSYTGVLTDYRKYFQPTRPFTFAIRGLHYGRYGSGGEDSRLSPLYIGYPGLVRGYEVNSFESRECAVTAFSDCAAFDNLLGSRMAIGNIELRMPLLGLFSRGRNYYGAFPVELALFGDAGVAWTTGSDPTFLGGDRDWARSIGAAIRVNALGYAVLEFDYVRPLDRPERGWVWQFNLIPGF